MRGFDSRVLEKRTVMSVTRVLTGQLLHLGVQDRGRIVGDLLGDDQEVGARVGQPAQVHMSILMGCQREGRCQGLGVARL